MRIEAGQVWESPGHERIVLILGDGKRLMLACRADESCSWDEDAQTTCMPLDAMLAHWTRLA